MSDRISNIFRGEPTIWLVYVFLSLISLVEVFSAASALSYKSGSYWLPLINQGTFLLLGGIAAFVLHHIPVRILRAFPVPMMFISLLLLVLTLLVGEDVNGASRWIGLFGIKFQPSEIAKGSIIMYVALILSFLTKAQIRDSTAMHLIVWPTLLLVGFIATENLSTAALIMMVVFMMLIIGRVAAKVLLKWTGYALLAGILAGSALMLIGGPDRMETWGNRLKTHMAGFPENPKDVDTQKYAQVAHSRIAIASSHIIGCGPGNSVERDFLSLAYSDFIYAFVIEELGLLGAAFILFLYIILLFRTGQIASQCAQPFFGFLAMGIALILVLQALVNMCVAVGIIPVTGQPLPLLSRGGTSILVTGAYFGIILSVSRFSRKMTKRELEAEAAKIENGELHANEPEFRKD